MPLTTRQHIDFVQSTFARAMDNRGALRTAGRYNGKSAGYLKLASVRPPSGGICASIRRGQSFRAVTSGFWLVS